MMTDVSVGILSVIGRKELERREKEERRTDMRIVLRQAIK
jgi:hypothetical protein